MAKAVGIDIGTEALRGVLLESRRGELSVVSAGAAPLGEWAALEDNQDKRLAIGEKLKELVADAGLRAPTRRITATGRGAAIRYLNVPPVPPWRLEMLARYEIEERVDEKEPSAYDYRILDVPDMGGQYTVMLAAQYERTIDWLMDISRQARLGEVEPDHKAIALYNAYYHGHGYDPDKTAVIVDVGADEVTVIVVRDGALYLARSFPSGGRRVTQALSEELKATILEAEEIKKNEAEILFDQSGATGATTIIRRPSRTAGMTTIGRRRLSRKAEEATEEPHEGPVAPSDPSEPAPPPLPADPSAPTLRVTPPAAEEPPTLELTPEPAPDQDNLELPAEVTIEEPQQQAPQDDPEQNDAAPAPTEPARPEDEEVLNVESERRLSAGDRAFLNELDNLQPAVRRKKQISQVLVQESAGLCAALESAINYCRGQYKMRDLKADIVYLTGAGSRLKGLPKLVSRRLRAPVEKLEVFRRLDLSRLPEEAADMLRAEQDRMAISTGAALSSLCKGAFSFLLWPKPLKERKEFWARGAYLYYAAALLLAALAIFVLTPYRNAQTLAQNEEMMTLAIQQAQLMEQELEFSREDHEELQRRLEQIDLNAKSGAFFLKVLAELKDPKRIPQDVWLTSLSTSLPSVILQNSGPEDKDRPVTEPGAQPAAAKAATTTPDTFQAQARVYLRGFVRSGQKKDLYSKIKGDRTKKPFIPGFSDLLVPYPDDPEHPRNLFRDIRPVWIEPHDHPQEARYLKEFVLEAYVEGSRDLGSHATKKPASGQARPEATPPATKKAVPEKRGPVTEKKNAPAAKKAAPVTKRAAPVTKKVAPAVKKVVPAAKPNTKRVKEPDAKAF